MHSLIRRRILLGAAAGLALPLEVFPQGISNRPVRIILGQTAGTTPDLLARTLAPRMSAKWNQPFVVENRGGAGGAIGMDAVAKAPPDGHVISVFVNSTLTLPIFFKIDFDVLTGFTPLSVLAQNIFVLAVHPSVPVKSFPEFLDWAKREGGKANYGSPGNGTHHHLIMESVKLQTGVQITHIPYKGSAPAFTDLMGGQIACMFVPLGTAITLGGAGKIRPVAGSSRERSPLAPQIPSLHEQGLKDFDYYSWFSAWGPAGMPQDVVARYNTALHEVMKDPEVVGTLAKQGASVRLSTPQELDKLNREDYAALAKLIKDAKIKGD
ncbi:MAG TPA: tripartite tricarboxylate transporter substrate binding protein [Burkholderiales bacterium]|nr:tripartite tricarboxylate transporter substrate binding protein [Burkholderiales bacterium]